MKFLWSGCLLQQRKESRRGIKRCNGRPGLESQHFCSKQGSGGVRTIVRKITKDSVSNKVEAEDQIPGLSSDCHTGSMVPRHLHAYTQACAHILKCTQAQSCKSKTLSYPHKHGWTVKEIPEKAEVPHTLLTPEDQVLNWSGQPEKKIWFWLPTWSQTLSRKV